MITITDLPKKQKESCDLPCRAEGVRAMREGREGAVGCRGGKNGLGLGHRAWSLRASRRQAQRHLSRLDKYGEGGPLGSGPTGARHGGRSTQAHRGQLKVQKAQSPLSTREMWAWPGQGRGRAHLQDPELGGPLPPPTLPRSEPRLPLQSTSAVTAPASWAKHPRLHQWSPSQRMGRLSEEASNVAIRTLEGLDKSQVGKPQVG